MYFIFSVPSTSKLPDSSPPFVKIIIPYSQCMEKGADRGDENLLWNKTVKFEL
jgi:hypothetical protein